MLTVDRDIYLGDLPNNYDKFQEETITDNFIAWTELTVCSITEQLQHLRLLQHKRDWY